MCSCCVEALHVLLHCDAPAKRPSIRSLLFLVDVIGPYETIARPLRQLQSNR